MRRLSALSPRVEVNALRASRALSSDAHPISSRSKNSEDLMMSRRTILIWFRTLRAQYRWRMFEAIRYALWLTR
jgi:hypothetical protein